MKYSLILLLRVNCDIIRVLIASWLFALGTIQAQEVVSSAGSYNKGSTAQISWTIGELAIKAAEGTNNTLTQGMQQSKLIVIPIKEAFKIKSPELEDGDIEETIATYPNPANDILQLKVERDELEGIMYRLYDRTGRLLDQNQIKSNLSTIPLSKYKPSTYILNIFENEKKLKSFIIEKK